jgi:hypothetical protein
MEKSVIKSVKGNKFVYTYNGEVVRTSTREYKYACIATFESGASKVISMGNKADSTYNSYARFYQHCKLEIVEIQ